MNDQTLQQPQPRQNHTSGYWFFLTGASGFLGNFILEQLLLQFDRPDVFILCLIRSKNEVKLQSTSTTAKNPNCLEASVKGYDEIVRRLQRRPSWKPQFESRIKLLHGDITAYNLRLSEKAYYELCSNHSFQGVFFTVLHG